MLDRMMLASNADDGQHDGHGIAVQSGIVFKSQYPYWATEPDYLKNLEHRTNGHIIIGHVRKASIGTEKFSALAAHPYIFFVDERPLLIAHNGFIEGTPRGTYNANEPNTDTFRAAKVLVTMFQAHIRLTGSLELTDDLLEAWMQTFYRGSVYVIFLLWNDELIIIRGNAHRTMYLNKVGNGYIFNTSRDVVDVTSARLKHFGVEVGNVIHYLSEYTITRCRAGSHLLDITSYVPEYDDWPKYVPNSHAASGQGSTGGGGRSAPAATVSTAIVVPAPGTVLPPVSALRRVEDDSDVEEFYFPSRVDNRRPRRNVESNEAYLRREIMTHIRAELNPMRSTTIFYWIAEIFGFKTDKGIDYNAVLDMPPSDLQDFLDYMAPAMSKSEDKKMFSPKQKTMINLWNKLVPIDRDQEMLARFTKSWDYFWIKTDVDIQTLETYIKSLLNSKPNEPDPFLEDYAVIPAA
jgi:predicted glutamine amidotransferase